MILLVRFWSEFIYLWALNDTGTLQKQASGENGGAVKGVWMRMNLIPAAILHTLLFLNIIAERDYQACRFWICQDWQRRSGYTTIHSLLRITSGKNKITQNDLVLQFSKVLYDQRLFISVKYPSEFNQIQSVSYTLCLALVTAPKPYLLSRERDSDVQLLRWLEFTWVSFSVVQHPAIWETFQNLPSGQTEAHCPSSTNRDHQTEQPGMAGCCCGQFLREC